MLAIVSRLNAFTAKPRDSARWYCILPVLYTNFLLKTKQVVHLTLKVQSQTDHLKCLQSWYRLILEIGIQRIS